LAVFFCHFDIIIVHAYVAMAAAVGVWSRCERGRGYITLAINAERGRVASSAIGFNVGAGVQATGADFSGRRSG
jgi:hypothetical protein